MIEILLIMASGIITGVLIRRKKSALRIVDRAVIWSIYFLLFSLGLAIGSNNLIMAGLPVLGVSALYITLGGLAGSIALALVLWKFVFFRNR